MPRIATFWHEGPLRFVDQVCMASWLRNGHDVDLYCNAIPPNLPKGVRPCDASKILDPILMERLHPKYHLEKLPFQAVVSFSDMMRMALFKNNAGFWLDTDTYLFSPVRHDPKKPFFAKDGRRIGISALYFPSDSNLLTDYFTVFDSDILMPPWTSWEYKTLRPFLYNLLGRSWAPSDFLITLYGNHGMTRLVKKHGIFKQCTPQKSFYYWTGNDCFHIYDPERYRDFKADNEVTGFHIHRKGPSNQSPAAGSIYEEMVDLVSGYLPADSTQTVS